MLAKVRPLLLTGLDRVPAIPDPKEPKIAAEGPDPTRDLFCFPIRGWASMLPKRSNQRKNCTAPGILNISNIIDNRKSEPIYI